MAGKSGNSSAFYSRVVTNQLRYGPLSKDFLPAPSPVNIYSENTQELYTMGINSLAADYLGGEEVKDHIWSWKPDLDISSLALHFQEMCVLMDRETGQWDVLPCSYSLRVLCKNDKNSSLYMVGARISNPQLFISPIHDGIQKRSSQTLCPSGYSFKPPTTSYITSFLISIYIGEKRLLQNSSASNFGLAFFLRNTTLCTFVCLPNVFFFFFG